MIYYYSIFQVMAYLMVEGRRGGSAMAAAAVNAIASSRE